MLKYIIMYVPFSFYRINSIKQDITSVKNNFTHYRPLAVGLKFEILHVCMQSLNHT